MTIGNRFLSALVVGATLALTGQHANADDAACEAVLQAVIKQTTVPIHQKISTETAAARGKLLQSETIHIGDTLYIQVRGQWTTRPYDARKAADDARQALVEVEHTCSCIGSEAVGGQAAELYSVQSKKGTVSTDSNIWISTSSGLPLHQNTTTRDQGLIGMKHDVSFDYANVAHPQVSHADPNAASIRISVVVSCRLGLQLGMKPPHLAEQLQYIELLR